MTITKANLEQMRELIDALEREKIEVVRQANYTTRDVGGTFGPWVDGVVHHDASTPKAGVWGSIGVIIRGRPAEGIPGPLSQCQIARGDRPRIAIITAGRGNHAGRGGPYGIVPRDAGNRWLIGTEVANDGVGEPYSNATLDTIEAWGYHVKRLAASPGSWRSSIIGHREWAADPFTLDTPFRMAAGRKPDPRYRMSWMRERINNHGFTQEDDLTPQQAETLDTILAELRITRGKVEHNTNLLTALRSAVTALAVGGDYDVIREDGTAPVYIVAGDVRVHVTSEAALAPFGGRNAIEVVKSDDPRLQLPVISEEEE